MHIRLLNYQRYIHALRPMEVAHVELSWRNTYDLPEDRVVCTREVV